jgi:hypothetical protein
MVLEDTPRIPAYRYPEALCQLVMQMFALNPKGRPTALDIVQAPWLQAYNRAGLARAMRSHTNLLLNNKSWR